MQCIFISVKAHVSEAFNNTETDYIYFEALICVDKESLQRFQRRTSSWKYRHNDYPPDVYRDPCGQINNNFTDNINNN